MDMEEAVPIFWDQKIPPGRMQLNFDEGFNLVISNSSLENVKEKNELICRLFAEVSIPTDLYDEKDDVAGEPNVQRILLSSLRANKKETQMLEMFFSPINVVVLDNTSPYTFHLMGSLHPIPDFVFNEGEIESEEEEEEEGKEETYSSKRKRLSEKEKEEVEEVDVEEIQSKVKEFMMKTAGK